MRFRRLSFFAGWLAVALLAAAGLAAFGPTDGEEADTAVAVASQSMGHTAGAYAGLSFGLLGGPIDNPTTTDDTLATGLDDRQDQAQVQPKEDRAAGTIASETSGWLSEVEVRALITTYFTAQDVNKAVRVAWCESRFNPQSSDLRTGAVGLFHHLPRYWTERSTAAGFPGADLTDPEASVAAAAWAVYNGGGWDVFSCRG